MTFAYERTVLYYVIDNFYYDRWSQKETTIYRTGHSILFYLSHTSKWTVKIVDETRFDPRDRPLK